MTNKPIPACIIGSRCGEPDCPMCNPSGERRAVIDAFSTVHASSWLFGVALRDLEPMVRNPVPWFPNVDAIDGGV